MAIQGPSDLPLVLKVDSNPLKHHVISQLGHPLVLVEIMETQMEQVLRSTGDFISTYFPQEERYAFFMTSPLKAEYELPADAYWVREVSFDPVTTRISDIFGAESFLFNIGNVTGIQNLLLDYHMLQAYRKFSQKILGTEGQWEFSVEAGTIRLFPVPKGSFPVVVRYLPSVGSFKSPWAREITYRATLARMKEALGYARRKISSIPGPDGSAISYDGDALVQEGKEEYKECVENAILHGEPLGIYVW